VIALFPKNSANSNIKTSHWVGFNYSSNRFVPFPKTKQKDAQVQTTTARNISG